MSKKKVALIFALGILVGALAGFKLGIEYNLKKINNAVLVQEESKATIAKNKVNEQMTKLSSLINNDDNRLFELVNKDNILESSYIPSDLVYPKVNCVISGKDNRNLMRRTAASALEEMFNAAKKDNVQLYLNSAFRAYLTQKAVYQAGAQSSTTTGDYIARPGESEHQTGLAVDICSKSANFKLDENFGNTKEGKWLLANAYKYGFILRYPKDKESITGYNYEAWHYRYVGTELAEYLNDNKLTLDEVYNQVKLTKK